VVAQTRRARAIAVLVLRDKQRPWRKDRAYLMGLNGTSIGNLFGNISV
jgi:hypothetical protein